ncbi:hypothetical protein SDRG_10843 [Saprolegnia diclina VS20]|uniref:Uncharacterized protein n=1 Tax=Saprolegnia diclina (strain VS20) TaxID=1156394 RepID=T0QDL7_SAPDV|nr:hypothetical protein SDRG_10843 [Saprolegnia diclina VS20]EQC31680.1 hypothetical protein SDRG_10843 [Saprolegnia diclina VS20]|eukprot:XP_008615079.1 hypothetical protein SDRG_10843 [Saprolegnia diclina VS20]
MEPAAYSEVYRLKSNHSELQMHKRTLERQLEIKKDQLKELQRAIAACEAATDDASPRKRSSAKQRLVMTT